ncbi:MAG TPA: AsmA family protein, partial [Bacteroidales bacterium]|nr:AsmA family protein [Bacteroidales bacterium]
MRPVINRILKILKKTLLILVIILGSLILTGTIFFMIYRDSIRQAVLYEVNRHLTAEVEAGKIRVSLLSHFPMLSVTMNDLRISGPAGLHGDADMLSTDELSLRFDIMDVLHGKYTMEAVQLSNARINLIVSEDGSDNFHFWKQPSSAESSPLSIEIRQVILRMVDISWQNLSSGESYSLRVINSKARGNVTEKNYEL